jgi:hypothetical protein
VTTKQREDHGPSRPVRQDKSRETGGISLVLVQHRLSGMAGEEGGRWPAPANPSMRAAQHRSASVHPRAACVKRAHAPSREAG